ncbi:threonine synthase [Marinococcus luteus]|uniref:threonine synthase n=1 Tax=Marinococcus luteus TaxID=1122204 RepID=UPI002ACCF212|nr:threonine synthase [Marinococcus luteus]MDZ5784035.1 threonine synthase [Marinococcus luteus]
MNQYICSECEQIHPIILTIWKCPVCGGVLDLLKETPSVNSEVWESYPLSIWRYAETMPFSKETRPWEAVSMGEGQTPMLPLSPGDSDVYVKVDYMMPTLSFKDRGAVALITKAKELGAKKVISDSSGNAGTAMAAYAARAGIACDVYVSAETSPKKIDQISAHGARIQKIQGAREEVAAAAQRAVEQEQVFYASHVYNPYFFEGTKSYAYEIYEQLGRAPETVIVPVGNGTLLLGAYYGFHELLANNLINQMPKILAVQADNCAPLVQAYEKGAEIAEPTAAESTLAEGIAIAAPARSAQILQAVRQTNGTFIRIPEGEIISAREALADKGFYVEITSAINYAGYLQYQKEESETVVIPLCGAGIKSS